VTTERRQADAIKLLSSLVSHCLQAAEVYLLVDNWKGE